MVVTAETGDAAPSSLGTQESSPSSTAHVRSFFRERFSKIVVVGRMVGVDDKMDGSPVCVIGTMNSWQVRMRSLIILPLSLSDCPS